TAALLAGCGGVPTNLLLTLQMAPGVQAPDTVQLRVYDNRGVFPMQMFTVPATAQKDLGTVVVYARSGALTLRLDGVGMKARAMVAEGVGLVTLDDNQQTEGTLTLSAGSRADGDKDGVPDAIDNCPTVANPDQKNSTATSMGDACRKP